MTQEKKSPNMEGPSLAGYVFFFFFFHLLSGFRGFPKAVPVSIALWMLILFLIYSILCSEALLQRCLFFFLQPVAGLTNWDRYGILGPEHPCGFHNARNSVIAPSNTSEHTQGLEGVRDWIEMEDDFDYTFFCFDYF